MSEEEVRLRDAMPRPLLAVFAVLAIAGLAATVALLIRPPQAAEVPLAERRPAARAPYDHDPIEVFPAPVPEEIPAFRAPCEEVAGARPEGGPSFVARVRDAMSLICGVAKGGPDAELTRAARAFDGVTIRIAEFARSGIESTLDEDARVVWVNLKLTARQRTATELAPVLLHEAVHLLEPGGTAAIELRARRVEDAACRTFLRPADRPFWCQDAAAIIALPEPEALALLAAAGFPPA
ncbi:MAG TPA: hypothetical protein VGB83_11325 [Actinomycetota bacterium]